MAISALLLFSFVFAVACASPGPATAALVARVLGNGRHGALQFCSGLLLGDLAWLGVAAFGLAAIATTFQPMFLVLKYCGAAYLLYLGYKIWIAPPTVPVDTPLASGDRMRLFAGGVSLALGNPKTMLFYLALLPTILDLGSLTAAGFAALAATVTIIYSAVLTAYVLLALRARMLFRSASAMKLANRVTGGVMVGAAAAVAAR